MQIYFSALFGFGLIMTKLTFYDQIKVGVAKVFWFSQA
jgi:hypothetical protein